MHGGQRPPCQIAETSCSGRGCRGSAAFGRSGRRRRQVFERRAIAIGCCLAVGVKGLPDDAVRIGYPALLRLGVATGGAPLFEHRPIGRLTAAIDLAKFGGAFDLDTEMLDRSEEHTSELQSLMRISYA